MSINPCLAKFSLGLGVVFALIHPTFAQITPSGAGTVANPQGNQINISGGTQAGANLFHSFRDFNVNSSQVANFLSNPQIQNILARVNGGNPSFINGLLQVTGGNSNLFLMNPAGIVFGQGASLNIPASFTATTANQIGFGNNLFNAFGDNNFSALVGNPDSFIFTTNQAGSIVNAGNLAVGSGQNISLIGGNTVNTGRLSAPGGEIQVLAVPGTNRVRLSQPGQVLSLEIVPPLDGTLRAVDLPALLTGSDLPGIGVNSTGQVQVAGTSLPNQQGIAVASGRIDVSSAMGNGGTVQVMGDRVAALDTRINANGATGGGTVRLGGEYLGGRDTGIAPVLRFNSQRTLVDRNSLIRANATVTGEGGRVIVWADQNTGYFGRITGRGATGRGAFVEISGRENLAFDGRVEIPGANGLFGSLLLDPLNVVISAATTDDTQIADGIIGAAEAPGATWFISAGALNGIPGGTPISIAATNNIDFQAPIVNLTAGTGAVSFTAPTITASAGTVTLNTYGRNVTMAADIIDAANLTIDTANGGVRTGIIQATANNGNLRLGGLLIYNDNVNGGDIILNAPLGAITIGYIDGFILFGTGNAGDISLTSQGAITIGYISSGTNTGNAGAINLTSQGAITTWFIFSTSSDGNGGAINLTSQGAITTGSIVSNSNNGNGGAVNLTSQSSIVTDDIISRGTNLGNTSGAIIINAGNLFRMPTSSGYCGAGISICSAGQSGAGNGAITIKHGGGITTPFTVGDASINGTAGAINAGTGNFINTTFSVPVPPTTYTQGIVQIITTVPPAIPPEVLVLLRNPTAPVTPAPVVVGTPPPPPEPISQTTSASPVISNSATTPVLTNTSNSVLNTATTSNLTNTPNPVINTATLPSTPTTTTNQIITPSTPSFPNPNTISPGAQSALATTLNILNPQISPSNNLIDRNFQSATANNSNIPIITRIPTTSLENNIRFLDDPFKEEFQAYTGISDEIATLDVNQAQDILSRISRETNVNPVFIYVFFTPPNEASANNRSVNSARTQLFRNPSDTDVLEVVLVPPVGDLVRVRYPGLTRPQVLQSAGELTRGVFRRHFVYANASKRMYDLIISRLEEDLKRLKIDNLVFLMDRGLRSMPIAAMQNKNNQFIIENYSVALMPSLTLTDTTYSPLQDSQVMAMGADQFVVDGLKPLPGVPVELSAINQIRGGNIFFNENFTLSNLRQNRSPNQRIVHLATHGSFLGDKTNSFIQLWGTERLTLDQIRTNGFGTPPVDLLVLSACETALGNIDAELGFAGLAVTSGVRSALASLWQVSDEGTMGLMAEFYQQLQATTTKSEALRQAQLAMLRGEVRLEGGSLVTPKGNFALNDELKKLGDRKLQHPYFWSAFTMIGNPW